MRSNSKIQENKLRSYIRNEIVKIIKEVDDQHTGKEKGVDQEAPKEEEPKKDRSRVLEKITNTYTKSLRNNLGEISTEEASAAFDQLMNNLGYGRDSKVGVIRSLKGRIQS